MLYFDTTSSGPGDKSRLDWWRNQLARLGIQLEVRESDWNRFQEKIRKGATQIYRLGWNADYPDDCLSYGQPVPAAGRIRYCCLSGN